MEQNKEYYAFISYKREDEKWAKWLQHKLEHYKLPSNLNGRTDLPREIRPIFRDTSELNPGNLPQQICNALSASRHLIVICSPYSAQSEWVNKEVETFIALGKQDCIIPFIIDGRPYADTPAEECFPPAIRSIPKEQEILGANITEMGRDAAAVKTVAQMFGVRFDTLWKRYEREQKRRRAFIITTVALFVLAVLGVAAYIWRQNNELVKRKAELQEAYDNLTTANQATEREKNRAVRAEQYLMTANDSIQYQYGIIQLTNANLVRTNNAKSLAQSRAAAEAAMKLIENGDAFRARKVALEALKIAPTVEAEAALRQANQQNTMVLNGHVREVRAIALSHDGRLMVSGSCDKTIRLWDLETGKQVGETPEMEEWVYAVSYGANDKRIAAALGDGTIRIWNMETGKSIKVPMKGYPIGECVLSADFSSDGERVVLALSDNTLRIWNVQTGEQIGVPLDSFTKLVFSVNFSPNGERIVTASLYDSTIRIWNVLTGKQIGPPMVGEYVTSVKYSIDGKHIVSGSGDGSIRLWDVQTGKQIGPPLIGHTNCVRSLAYSMDGKLIVSGSDDGTVRIWDAQTGKQIGNQLSKHSSAVMTVSFSPNGRYIISSSDDNSIRIWDTQKSHRFEIKMEKLLWFPFLSFSSDCKNIVSSSVDDNTIMVWDVKTGKQVGVPMVGHTGEVTFATFSSDGKRVVSTSIDGTIRIWDVRTGKHVILEKSNYYFEGNYLVKFSPDDKHIVSISENRNIKIWDVRTGKQVGSSMKGHTGWISSAEYSPNGEHVVSAARDGTIRIWDVKTCQQDGKPLAGHTGVVHYAEFSPDGKYIVSSSEDKTIRIWDVRMRKQMGEPFVGHTSDVRFVTFSPNGRYIVSTSDDGTIRVWDVKTRKQIESVEGGNFVTFSSDGRQIFSASTLGIINIWDFPPLEDLIGNTRKQFKDNPLTPEERKRYYLE